MNNLVSEATQGPEAHLGNSCWLESLIVNVRLDLLNSSVRDVVLVIFEEALKELAWVLQQAFTWLPVIILLLTWLWNQTQNALWRKGEEHEHLLTPYLVTSDFFGLHAFHDAHSLHDHEHTPWWPLQCTDLNHVVLVQRLQTGQSSILKNIRRMVILVVKSQRPVWGWTSQGLQEM